MRLSTTDNFLTSFTVYIILGVDAIALETLGKAGNTKVVVSESLKESLLTKGCKFSYVTGLRKVIIFPAVCSIRPAACGLLRWELQQRISVKSGRILCAHVSGKVVYLESCKNGSL